MAICLNCIQNPGNSSPCEGLEVIILRPQDVPTGPVLLPLTAVPNINSSIGFDYQFSTGFGTYTISYISPKWILYDSENTVLWSNLTTGQNNNLCPPEYNWDFVTNSNETFLSFNVNKYTPPNESVECLNQNITFDSDITGWQASLISWDFFLGGSAKYDNIILGYIQQTGILEIGAVYLITIDYYSAAYYDFCTTVEYQASTLKIFAGTNTYTHVLENTYYIQGGIKSITLELTCSGSTNFRIEVIDVNSCYNASNGFKGIYLDNICISKKNVVTTQEYTDIAEVPVTVNNQDFPVLLESLQNCLAKKGTSLYNKIIGAVHCNPLELQKLKLIIELLNQKDEDRALDCIYNKATIAGATYLDNPTGNLPTISEGDIIITVNGNLSAFESFTLYVESLEFSPIIVDAVYTDSNTTILTLSEEFPENLVGGSYEIKYQSENTNEYLATFIDFAVRFCSDCIVTPYPTPIAPTTPSLEIPETFLVGEDGFTQITTEFNKQITL